MNRQLVFASPDPDIDIPRLALTDYVFANVAQYADSVALIDGPSGRTLTYTQLHDAIARARGGLAALGFGDGDVLAIFSANVPEFVIAFHATASLGGAATTVNPLYTVDELSHQLTDSRASILITQGAFLDTAKAAAERCGIAHVITFDDADNSLPFSGLLTASPQPGVAQGGEQLVALPYSSGTTGLSKGVMLSHRNLVANICQFVATSNAFPIKRGDVLIAILPFFHIYGLQALMNRALSLGATLVTLPRFEMDTFLAACERYRVTVATLVPPIVLALVKDPRVDNYDLSSLRFIGSGAAPLGLELARAAEQRLGCPVRQGYGLTETSPVTHLTSIETDNPLTIGQCIANTQSRIRSLDTGEDLGRNETGELLIRGPQVMLGYLNKPEETARVIDSEGWFATGDIAYVNDDELFFIVDRLKELIKYKGYQVAPAELEALLVAHPAILDAAVIPSPDEEAGEVPKAFVVSKEPLTAEQVMDYIAERVSPQKRIRLVEFIDAIPKAPSGKILRRVLVERERKQRKD